MRSALAELLRSIDGIVLAYRSIPGEPDIDPLLGGSPERFALTRTPERGPLTLHPATAAAERHRFGFEQPVATAPELADDDIAAVLVPGLAFDHAGGRLGRGQGHYDRLLARLPAERPRIGIATLATVLAVVPTEDHDVRMTHLVTEAGVRDVRPTHPRRTACGATS